MKLLGLEAWLQKLLQSRPKCLVQEVMCRKKVVFWPSAHSHSESPVTTPRMCLTTQAPCLSSHKLDQVALPKSGGTGPLKYLNTEYYGPPPYPVDAKTQITSYVEGPLGPLSYHQGYSTVSHCSHKPE